MYSSLFFSKFLGYTVCLCPPCRIIHEYQEFVEDSCRESDMVNDHEADTKPDLGSCAPETDESVSGNEVDDVNAKSGQAHDTGAETEGDPVEAASTDENVQN